MAAKQIIFADAPNQPPPIGRGRPFAGLAELLRLNLNPGSFPGICWNCEGISAQALLEDRGYDTNDILAYAVSAGMEPVIPLKRKQKRGYDKYLYKLS